jgi:hypothetical protein
VIEFTMNMDQFLGVEKHFPSSLLESCGLFGMDGSLFGQSLATTSGQLNPALQSKVVGLPPASTLSPLSLTLSANHMTSFALNASTSPNAGDSNVTNSLNPGTAFLENLLLKQSMDQAQLNKLTLNSTRLPTSLNNHSHPSSNHMSHHESFSALAASLHQQLLAASQLNAIKLPITSGGSGPLLSSPIPFDFSAFLQAKSEASASQAESNATVRLGSSKVSASECSQPNSPTSGSSSGDWEAACFELTGVDTNGTTIGHCPTRLNEFNKQVFKEYQEWALRTYGDAAKTKTVTKKKYERIVNILNGQESQCLENSKFRFWVKSKGFRLCRREPTAELSVSGSGDVTSGEINNNRITDEEPDCRDFEEEVLYVPCPKASVGRRRLIFCFSF